MNVVTKIGKRVANTKIVRRAAEKVSSYPLVLTVEVNRLDGILAVNVPPPPTDTIWYVACSWMRMESCTSLVLSLVTMINFIWGTQSACRILPSPQKHPLNRELTNLA